MGSRRHLDDKFMSVKKTKVRSRRHLDDKLLPAKTRSPLGSRRHIDDKLLSAKKQKTGVGDILMTSCCL